MGSDESEERGRDQKAADDGHDHRDVDFGSEWRKRVADGGDDRRRDDAIGFPSRKISFKTLSIGSVEHRRGSQGGVVEASQSVRHDARHGGPRHKLNSRRRIASPHAAKPTYHRRGCIGNRAAAVA